MWKKWEWWDFRFKGMLQILWTSYCWFQQDFDKIQRFSFDFVGSKINVWDEGGFNCRAHFWVIWMQTFNKEGKDNSTDEELYKYNIGLKVFRCTYVLSLLRFTLYTYSESIILFVEKLTKVLMEQGTKQINAKFDKTSFLTTGFKKRLIMNRGGRLCWLNTSPPRVGWQLDKTIRMGIFL